MPFPSILESQKEQEKVASSRPPLRGERYGEEPPRRRSRNWLWLAIAGLAGVVGYNTWQDSPRLKQYGSELTKLSGLQETTAEISTRLGEAEQKIDNLPLDLDTVKVQASRMERKLSAGLDQARKDLQDLSGRLRRDVQSSSAAQRQNEARFERIEQTQRSQADRAEELAQQNAQLQQQVAGLNSRLSTVDQSLSREIAGARGASARETQELRSQLRQTSQRVTDYANRPRTRFEASKGKTEQIAPGVLLHIANTDTSYRRFRGWLQLVDEGKILWLRDQSMLQTFPFYAGRSTLRHDLVITGLDKGGVTGYVIFPSRGESESGGVASGLSGSE